MAIPNVDAEVLRLVVVEWSHALVPTALQVTSHRNNRLLYVAAILLLAAVATSLLLTLVTILGTSLTVVLLLRVFVFLVDNLLLVHRLRRRVRALVALDDCNIVRELDKTKTNRGA